MVLSRTESSITKYSLQYRSWQNRAKLTTKHSQAPQQGFQYLSNTGLVNPLSTSCVFNPQIFISSLMMVSCSRKSYFCSSSSPCLLWLLSFSTLFFYSLIAVAQSSSFQLSITKYIHQNAKNIMTTTCVICCWSSLCCQNSTDPPSHGLKVSCVIFHEDISRRSFVSLSCKVEPP